MSLCYRLRLALSALRGEIYLVGEYDETTEAEDTREFAGPLREIECDIEPGDSISCRPIRNTRHGGVVSIRMQTGEDEDAFIVLKAPHARQLAAGVLDAADEADGTVPSLFVAQSKPEEEG